MTKTCKYTTDRPEHNIFGVCFCFGRVPKRLSCPIYLGLSFLVTAISPCQRARERGEIHLYEEEPEKENTPFPVESPIYFYMVSYLYL